MREDIAVEKERELKDDGRYIIFYSFAKADEEEIEEKEKKEKG